MVSKIKFIAEVDFGKGPSMFKLEIWNRLKAVSVEKSCLSRYSWDFGICRRGPRMGNFESIGSLIMLWYYSPYLLS